MKKMFICLITLMLMIPMVSVTNISAASVQINSKNFPDKNFRNFVKKEYDLNGNGYLSSSEIVKTTCIDLNDTKVKSVKGIEYLTNLMYVRLYDLPITELDIGKNTKMVELRLINTKLKKVTNIKKLKKLKKLYISRDLMYTQNLENVKAENIYVDCVAEYWHELEGKYEHSYPVTYEHKLNLNYINSKWDTSKVKAVSGSSKSGKYLTNIEYGRTTISYKRNDGGSINIHMDFDNPKMQPELSRIFRPIFGYELKNYAGACDRIHLLRVGTSDYHELYRSTSKNGTYKKIADSINYREEYIDKNVVPGKTYYYRVRGYTKLNGHKVYTSVYSSKFKAKTEKPYDLEHLVVYYDDVNRKYTVEWDKVKGVDGYQIYIAKDINNQPGTFKKVATTTKNNKTLNYGSKEGKYYVKVRAYQKGEDGNIYGKFNQKCFYIFS